VTRVAFRVSAILNLKPPVGIKLLRQLPATCRSLSHLRRRSKKLALTTFPATVAEWPIQFTTRWRNALIREPATFQAQKHQIRDMPSAVTRRRLAVLVRRRLAVLVRRTVRIGASPDGGWLSFFHSSEFCK